MCIIIHREDAANVPNRVLDANRERNPDGFGVAWRSTGGLTYEKFGPKDYAEFRRLLKDVDQTRSEYVAHYRFATHGPPCKELSHPFEYTDPNEGRVLVFHNGVINISTEKGESDTSQFVKDVISQLPSGWWRNNATAYLVERAISGSRLILMTERETVRLNERAWVKRNGIMYSVEPEPPKYTWVGKASGKGVGSLYLPSKTGGKGTYVPPKAWLADADLRDTPTLGTATQPDVTVDTDKVVGWMHEGHWVESLSDDLDLNSDEDIAGEAVCTECNTLGEWYVIGGTTFIDLPHGLPERDEDDDDDLDGATMAAVYAS